MKKIILIALILTATINAFSQIDTTRKEFFPLHIGDLWQYRNESNQLLTARIGSDTIIDGFRYYVFKTIGGLKSSGGGIMRIDSLQRVDLYGTGSIYRLAEQDSSVWLSPYSFWGLPTPHPLVRFNGIMTSGVFGAQREIMHFDFGGTISGAPYDTLWGFGALLAKGIGIIQEQYYEGDYYILQGAIIDSVQYGTIVSVEEISATVPQQITLYQNYPNPFNPQTKIRYKISHNSYATLKVYNLLGQEITILASKLHQVGNYEIEFNASHLSSGVYIAVLQTNEARLMRRMLLVK